MSLNLHVIHNVKIFDNVYVGQYCGYRDSTIYRSQLFDIRYPIQSGNRLNKKFFNNLVMIQVNKYVKDTDENIISHNVSLLYISPTLSLGYQGSPILYMMDS